MSPDEQVALSLTVYGVAQDRMPVHLAADIAREVVGSLDDDATVEEAIWAFEAVFQRFHAARPRRVGSTGTGV